MGLSKPSIHGATPATAALSDADAIDETSTTQGIASGDQLDKAVRSTLAEVGYATGSSALSVSGSGDALTASTTFTGTSDPGDKINTADASALTGNITVTTDVPDGQTRALKVIPATGKTVSLAQTGMTFAPTANSTLLAALTADGTTESMIVLTRTGSAIDYTITP